MRQLCTAIFLLSSSLLGSEKAWSEKNCVGSIAKAHRADGLLVSGTGFAAHVSSDLLGACTLRFFLLLSQQPLLLLLLQLLSGSFRQRHQKDSKRQWVC